MAWPGTILTIKIIKEIELAVPSRQSLPMNNSGVTVAWGSLGWIAYSQARGTAGTCGTGYLTPSLTHNSICLLCAMGTRLAGHRGHRDGGKSEKKSARSTNPYFNKASAKFKPFCTVSSCNYRTTNARSSAPVHWLLVVPAGAQGQVKYMMWPELGRHSWSRRTPCQHLISSLQAEPWAFLDWNFGLAWTIWIATFWWHEGEFH